MLAKAINFGKFREIIQSNVLICGTDWTRGCYFLGSRHEDDVFRIKRPAWFKQTGTFSIKYNITLIFCLKRIFFLPATHFWKENSFYFDVELLLTNFVRGF